jgi:hypothetical protein
MLLSGHFPDSGTPDYDRAYESTHEMGGMVLGITVLFWLGVKWRRCVLR